MSVCRRREVRIARGAPILGIDVGEDFLDIAILSGDRAKLSYHRVALAGITRPIGNSIAKRIADSVGGGLRGGVALVDSPRTPRDVDCSGEKMILRTDAPAARIIDSSLRALLRSTFNGKMRPLSMFPTPCASYFAGCVAWRGAKPHLRTIAEELFTPLIRFPRASRDDRIIGGTFTRFMLAGFAVFPALESLGVCAWESYPDLQMRLWSGGASIPPKRMRAEALHVRQNICARLADNIEVADFPRPSTLDEADAAVLALSGGTGSVIELHCAPEGRFAIALDKAQSGGLQR